MSYFYFYLSLILLFHYLQAQSNETFTSTELNDETALVASSQEEESSSEKVASRPPKFHSKKGRTRDFLQFLQDIEYDHRQIPEGDDGLQINISVVVSNLYDVSEVTMDYEAELFYRELWRDNRLNFNTTKFGNEKEIFLHESYLENLWIPDTFIPNSIDSKNPKSNAPSVSHRSFLRLRTDGSILYSRRISVELNCDMDLTLFPFDTQVCKIGFESYGYSIEFVRYQWSEGSMKPLAFGQFSLPDYEITNKYLTSQIVEYSTGNYTRLHICMEFTRSAGFFIMQILFPATAIVFASWVALWLESETGLQDMITIIMAIVLLLVSYNSMMPRVSYLKAMDIYLGICLIIVFLALIKVAIMKYARNRVEKFLESKTDENDQQKLLESPSNGTTSLTKNRRMSEFYTKKNLMRFHVITQIGFLLLFIILCVLFYLHVIFSPRQIDPDCSLDQDGVIFLNDDDN